MDRCITQPDMAWATLRSYKIHGNHDIEMVKREITQFVIFLEHNFSIWTMSPKYLNILFLVEMDTCLILSREIV